MLNKAIKKAKENKKGFTLAELLIVVAIIAVLVAISIQIFTTQLEKARQSTDAANCRAIYAEAMVQSLDNNGEGTTAPVVSDAVMQSDSWNKLPADTKIGEVPVSSITKTKGKTMTCTISDDGTVTFTASK